MINLKSLLVEAFSPDKEEFEAAATRSEYKIIDIIMDKTGHVFVDDYTSKTHVVDPKEVRGRLTLDYNKNRIRIYSGKLHGSKIDPGVQQLLAILLKKEVIDSTWKVSFSDEGSWYTKGEYVYKPGKFENLPPNFWKRNQRIDLGENLTMYHGTSEKELPTILKYGIRPLGSKHTAAGGESRMRVEDNENFIYLAGTFVDAFRYAELKARWNMRAENKEQYSYVEHWEWERWFIKPVVLLVRLPDFTKLRSDDDRVISLIKTKADELWKAMDPEKKRQHQLLSAKWFKDRGIDYKPENIEDYLWTISDNGFQEVLTHIDRSEWKNWKASLGSHNQVAYKGVISPSHISVVDLNQTYKKPRTE